VSLVDKNVKKPKPPQNSRPKSPQHTTTNTEVKPVDISSVKYSRRILQLIEETMEVSLSKK